MHVHSLLISLSIKLISSTNSRRCFSVNPRSNISSLDIIPSSYHSSRMSVSLVHTPS
uniref:Uncharacterized protein n=1 Tax=uncultured marine virus TaxID=186617 RepID=A0A0F7L2J9_9VIRU|nr:hypothetical protein [uncultured marine virus]